MEVDHGSKEKYIHLQRNMVWDIRKTTTQKWEFIFNILFEQFFNIMNKHHNYIPFAYCTLGITLYSAVSADQ